MERLKSQLIGRNDSPKDMTRIACRLLRFGWMRKLAMEKTKTHFEQIPVDVVKKIAEKDVPKRKETENGGGHATPTPKRN